MADTQLRKSDHQFVQKPVCSFARVERRVWAPRTAGLHECPEGAQNGRVYDSLLNLGLSCLPLAPTCLTLTSTAGMEVYTSASVFVFFAFLGVVASLRNLRATVITGTFIKLEWENDVNDKYLKPEYDVHWGWNSSLQTNATTAKLTELEPGKSYIIRVNDGGKRPFYNEIRVLTASLRLSLQRSNHLRVAWDSAFKNLKSVQVAYRLELTIKSRVPSSNFIVNETKIVNSSQAKILDMSVPYFVRITVCLQTLQQRDEWSQQICDSLTTNPGTPGLIRNLKITPDVHSLGLSWEDPDDTPPTGLLDRVNIAVSNTCKTLLMFQRDIHGLVRDSGKRSFTVTNLQPDSDYTIKMGALNKGYGQYKSVELNARTLPGVPSSPRALLALPWSSTEVLLSWAPPNEPLGALLNYTVWVNGKVDTCKEDTLQVLRCKIDGLTPGENYHTEVAACNKLHCGSVVAKEVAMPSARVFPVWIPVLFALLLFIVLGLLAFMLWRSKKVLKRLNEKNRLMVGMHTPAPDGIRQPGEEAVLATDKPVENQTSNPDLHVYESPYTLGAIHEPQVSQASIHLVENHRQNNVSDATYANISAVSEHHYANI
ncbi:cell adhesion molecule Dscam2-like [Penaeus indicus]|uniref:cell adhesion molecule Dscam2-like n=1 Tax=Penaeus indicus TaxID=29960 RepID=UPI00300C6E65